MKGNDCHQTQGSSSGSCSALFTLAFLCVLISFSGKHSFLQKTYSFENFI